MNFTKIVFAAILVLGGGLNLSSQVPAGFPKGPDLSVVKPVLLGASADGTEKRVEIAAGSFMNEGWNLSGMSKQTGISLPWLGGVFCMSTPGVDADVVAPQGLKAILLPGYSPKLHGTAGNLVLFRFGVAKDKRWLFVYNQGGVMAVAEGQMKGANDVAKVVRGNDGIWRVDLSKALEPGHYGLAPVNGVLTAWFWDFDIK